MSDEWDFFFLHVDDKPASIFVDLGIRNAAPIQSHPFMGYVRVVMRHPRADGLSSREEFDDLAALEDSVTPQIVREGIALFVGRNTNSGNRDFYFYVTDPARFENAARAAMLNFPAYLHEIGAREDREWRTYFDFLYPSDASWQHIMNRRVLISLEENGDNGSNERKIDHFVMLPSSSAQSAYLDYIRADGFTVDNAPREPDEDGRYIVAFSKLDQPLNMDVVVIPLFHKAIELGGSYDGWGCEATPRPNS